MENTKGNLDLVEMSIGKLRKGISMSLKGFRGSEVEMNYGASVGSSTFTDSTGKVKMRLAQQVTVQSSVTVAMDDLRGVPTVVEKNQKDILAELNNNMDKGYEQAKERTSEVYGELHGSCSAWWKG